MFPLIAGFNSAWNLAIAAAKSLISGDEFIFENRPLLALVVKGCRIPPLVRREVLIWPLGLAGIGAVSPSCHAVPPDLPPGVLMAFITALRLPHAQFRPVPRVIGLSKGPTYKDLVHGGRT